MEYLLLKPIEYEESLPIGSVIKISDGLCKLDNGGSIPVQWLCDHGYLKEIPEEPTQVPEWFKAFSTECYDMEDVGEMTDEGFAEEYEAFLKHYPRQEELPVEEIIQKMKIAWREPGIGSDIRHSFEDILRTYTIKQDAVQHLDTKEYKSMYGGKLSQEAIDKGVEALRGDCLQPLDVEKIAIMILTNLDIPVGPYGKSIAQCTVESILSNYGTPKITKREIENEASKRRTNREECAEAVTDFLDSKGLLDKSK